MSKRQGKGARQRAKERRKVSKRARKEQRQTEWQAAAARGHNRKKKKSGRAKRKTVRSDRHSIVGCGNLGCAKCNPMFSTAIMAKEGSALYAKQWSGKQVDA